MTKKQDRAPVAAKKKASLKDLAEGLQEAAEIETIAQQAETDLAGANKLIVEQHQQILALKEKILRLEKAVDLTEEDVRILTQFEAKLEFKRNFKTGKHIVGIEGQATTGPRRRIQGDNILLAVRAFRQAAGL